MYDFTADLIFHFLIMMMIPFIHKISSHQGDRWKTSAPLFSGLFLALFLTMTFPVEIAGGQFFDLKFIPVFVAYFYINPVAGFLTIFVLISFKGFFSPGDIWIALVNYTFISLLFFYASKFYKKCTFRQKLSIAVLFYLPITITRYVILLQKDIKEDAPYLLLFSAVSIVTLSMIIYLIEMNLLQEKMMQKLRDAEKINAISQLAASIAHEIRNPMTTVRGFLQMLKNEKNLTADQKSFIKVSLEELDRTNHIISDFLSLARPETPGASKVSLSGVLLEAADFMRPYGLMTKVEIRTSIFEGIFIMGNPNEMKQLFINVMKNSIEAMPDGGILEVKAFKRNIAAEIQIKDEGVGMSKEKLQMLGQPYYSTKTKGTGLGLMISFDIISRLKGKYLIESTQNKGTNFTISLPLYYSSEEVRLPPFENRSEGQRINES
ncbi:two-component system sporulation sensor kinase B [Cytobacillus firmus]|uniref:histidine kinase n=2 Tax=Cytobacillus TaxID=2675230 RepID=A0A366K442_CYTFI|nr:HAMP domain-containing sensor histidine kinase [Cytobacillus oceanisediminis]RBP96444.1 two-component system sporulation sensor kinase B [Cytobacillus firmus]TDX45829.1 two-component system sporulation sensor kinase B [Cytobacillus oceanisediminis]